MKNLTCNASGSERADSLAPRATRPHLADRPRPALVTAAQAAREVFGVSERTFHNWRSHPWMPRPVACGPRLVKWVRAELEAAVANMPRQAAPRAEPVQLRALRTGQAGDR